MTHVLVARLDNDGDVLLTGPATRAIAAGADRVTFLCSPRAVAAAELLPGVDEVVPFEAVWISADPPPLDHREVLGLVGRLAGLAIDRAVIFTSFHQSPLPLALLLRMAWIHDIAAISEDYPGSLLDVRHHVPDDIHEVERALSLAQAAGFPMPLDDDGRLRVRRDPSARPDGLPPGPYVVVHPGASVPARAWPAARNAELVAALSAQGTAVVVTGSAGERALCGLVAGDCPGVVNLAGLTTIAGLAEVLAGAEALVVGNTGPAHLAAAVGTPVVSLFAPTVPAVRWRPWKVPHVLLGHQDIGCAGCRARVCPLTTQPCLSTVRVPDVVSAIAGLRVARMVAA